VEASELGVLIERAIETVAMAVVGTTIGVVKGRASFGVGCRR
jgi:hypothetical protein